MIYRTFQCGICEWKQKGYSNIICVGGTTSYMTKMNEFDNENRSATMNYDEKINAFNCAQSYDGYKDKWYKLPNTEHSHRAYPCVKVLDDRGVIIVIGDGSKYDTNPNYHSHGGYIEMLDPRDSKQKWMVVKKLKKMVYNANTSNHYIYDLKNRSRSVNPSLHRVLYAM